MSNSLADFLEKNIDWKHQVIADVGASTGIFTILFEHWAEGTSEIHAFEPHPGNKFILLKKCWAVINLTLHDAVGIYDGEIGLSWGGKPADWGTNAGTVPLSDPRQNIKVRCSRLQTTVPNVTVMKMDIEGYEHVVLSELRGLDHLHTIQVELHNRGKGSIRKTVDHLISQGFTEILEFRGRDIHTMDLDNVKPNIQIIAKRVAVDGWPAGL